jgi:hypothetical protein
MDKRAGKTVVFLLWVFCVAGCLLTPGQARAEDAPNQEALRQDPDFPRHPSLAQQAAMIWGESLDQSLVRIRNINMFFFSGVPDCGEIIWQDTMTLSDKREFLTVGAIMKNRRVLKIREELAALPEPEAAGVLNAHLQEIFTEYQAAFRTDKGVNNPAGFTHGERNQPGLAYGGLGYVITTVDPNEVTLTGLRYAVLSLVLIASSLDLGDIRQTVIAIAEEGRRQRDALRADQIHHNAYKRSVLEGFSVYNRTILGTALLRLTPGLEAQLVFGGDLSLEPQAFQKTPYDDTNAVRRWMRGGNLDFISLGKAVVDYYTGITDDELDRILDAAAGAVASAAAGEE